MSVAEPVAVINTRNEKKGTALRIDDFNWQIMFEDGDAVSVSDSTFKRWYRKIEIAEVLPQEEKKIKAAKLPNKTVMEEKDGKEIEMRPVVAHLIDYKVENTGKSQKVELRVSYRNFILKITSYGPTIQSVRVFDADGTQVYNSKKFSISDALQYLEADGETIKWFKDDVKKIRTEIKG